MFLTDEEFRLHVAGALKIDVSGMAGYWDTIAKLAHESAYYDVRGALLARGFTATEVDNWARGPEFERDIGLYWCGVKGRWDAGDLQRLMLLDRRKELEVVPVEVVGGTPQEPTGSPARIVFGMLTTTDPVTGLDDKWTRDTVL